MRLDYKIDGSKFRALRGKMTRAELSQKAGVSDSAISAMENNRVASPGVEMMMRLADALGIEFVDFVDQIRAKNGRRK